METWQFWMFVVIGLWVFGAVVDWVIKYYIDYLKRKG